MSAVDAKTPASLDEALETLAHLAPAPTRETVRLEDADGRVLATPAFAVRTSPAAAVSAMDGYAVREADLGRGGARLRIAGCSYAGAVYSGALAPGECVRIFTGAPVPANADRVIVQEEVCARDGVALMPCAISSKRHIRAVGSDLVRGAMLAPAGLRLTPQSLIAIAAGDVGSVSVFAKPRVSIICTGDELVEPGQANERSDATPDSVGVGVAALVRRWGAQLIRRSRVGDRLDALRRAADAALDESDIVVVIGGASVGVRDHAKAMFAHAGLDIAVAKVAMRPGKPVWFGRAAGRIVVGLPGSPSAALVTARLFLAPLIAAAGGGCLSNALGWRRAPLATDMCAGDLHESLLRGCEAGLGVAPLGNQDSSAQGALAAATLIIRRRAGAPTARVGECVDVLDL